MIAKPEEKEITHWVTGTRTGVCRRGHPYISFRESPNGSVVETRGDCHYFKTCGTCKECSFGVQSAGHGTISWYHCTPNQMQQMLAMPPTTKTWILLEFLGFANGREDE